MPLLNDHLFRKEVLIQFTMCVFRHFFFLFVFFVCVYLSLLTLRPGCGFVFIYC